MTTTALAPALPTRTHAAPFGVVLVHGMRQHGRTWAAQEAHLADAGHHVAAVDLPGHGARLDERFTLAAAHDVIDEAVATFPDEAPVVLVGQSLGGYVSLGWAARHGRAGSSRRLAGVVASGCSTDPRGKPVAAYRDLAHAAARAGGSVLRRLRRSAAPALPGEGGPTTPRPGWGLVTDALGQLAGRSSLADLAAVRAPVWIVNGARCHLRWQEQRYLRTAERGALVVVPRTGHDVQLEAPHLYNRMLTRALAEFAHH